MKSIPVQINRIGNQLKKVFAYGDAEEKLALLKVMQYHLEFNKFALVEAKKEEARTQLQEAKESVKRMEERLASLEKEGNPFHEFTEDEKPSPTVNSNHSVRVGGNTSKDHSRKEIILDRAAVMVRIGKGEVTNRILANHFGMVLTTFRDKANALKIPRVGEKFNQRYITDEQDGFKSFNELGKVVPSVVTRKTMPEKASLLEAGLAHLKEEESFETLLTT